MNRPVALCLAAIALVGASSASGYAENLGDSGKGQIYAERNCSVCHALDPAVRLVPEGRPASFRMIANVPGMTAIALEVWFRTPHPTMPNIVIPGDERNNLIAYILTFKDR